MSDPAKTTSSPWEILRVFFLLGCTSFGGPVAHLGYFHRAFVQQRAWLSESAYADLVALCQFLPGPASSQVGMGIGMRRAGHAGALAAWIGFTLPSALAMILFALGLAHLDLARHEGWLHGLKVAAVAVVAQAVWGMARSLCPDRTRASLALGAAMVVSAWPTVGGQLLVILLGALAGWRWLGGVENREIPPEIHRSHGRGLLFLALFALLLILLPILAPASGQSWLMVADSFYRSGALVFGGGHVVLPLLQSEVVPTGWLDVSRFLAGYGAAQAVPGPLFTFAAYLGAAMNVGPSGWAGGLLALGAVFLPSYLLLAGVLPYWERVRAFPLAQAALRGINAAVVGLLLAALYHPVWTSGILSNGDFALALGAWGMLMFWKAPPWAVVAGCALLGWIMG